MAVLDNNILCRTFLWPTSVELIYYFSYIRKKKKNSESVLHVFFVFFYYRFMILKLKAKFSKRYTQSPHQIGHNIPGLLKPKKVLFEKQAFIHVGIEGKYYLILFKMHFDNTFDFTKFESYSRWAIKLGSQ